MARGDSTGTSSDPKFAVGNVIRNVIPSLLGLAVMLLVGGSCVSCFGLPSMVHQPSATRIYDLPLPNSRWAIHPIDRLIARAADEDCAGVWFFSDDFFTEDGRNTYQESRYTFPEWIPDGVIAWAYAPSGEYYVSRKGRMGQMLNDTDFLLSNQEKLTARGLRAAYRAGELDVIRLRAWLNEYCPRKFDPLGLNAWR